MKPSADLLAYGVQELDGIPGRLTLFGVRCRDKKTCSKEIVDMVASEAGKLSREEVMKMVAYSRRYGMILNFLSMIGEATWSQIKSTIEVGQSRSIANSAVTTLIRNLTKIGVIIQRDGKYSIADPILMRGLREEPLPE